MTTTLTIGTTTITPNDLATLLRRGIRSTRAIAAQKMDDGLCADATIQLAIRGEELVEWLEQTAPARAEED